jgi:hypothetical protein
MIGAKNAFCMILQAFCGISGSLKGRNNSYNYNAPYFPKREGLLNC